MWRGCARDDWRTSWGVEWNEAREGKLKSGAGDGGEHEGRIEYKRCCL